MLASLTFERRQADEEKHVAGFSKIPDFSPAQPWSAETRLVPGKGAASEDRRRGIWGARCDE